MYQFSVKIEPFLFLYAWNDVKCIWFGTRSAVNQNSDHSESFHKKLSFGFAGWRFLLRNVVYKDSILKIDRSIGKDDFS